MKTSIARRALSILGALVLCMSLAVPAFAATTYEPVAGTSTTFNKYLIMDAGDSVPNVTFSFTVAPGDAVSADTSDNDVFQVLPGIGTPTIADVTFGPSDATATDAGANIDVARAASERADGLTAANGVELEAGEKYATKQATVSFDGITYPEPGVYRYIVTETANAENAAAGIMHDNDTDRVLDVYVVDNNGALEIASYVLHTDVSNPAINEEDMGTADVAAAMDALDDKTDGFTNEYNSKDLVFKKEVEGNQASRDKWFEFTATLADVNDADVYVVSLADDQDANTTDGNADATSGNTAATRESNQGKTNPTQVTGAELKAGVKFYLQHGQSIAIRGIAPNATYTITEDAEDYKSDGAAVAEFEDATTGVIGTIAGENKAVKTSYLNTREGVVPTGVMVTVLPAMAIVGLGGAGLYVFGHKKSKDEDEI